MKTLRNHTLIYDDQCPLCVAYTGAFINSGMLDAQGRMRYEEGLQQYGHLFDAQRAKNEIALIDTATGKAYYGIESLVKVLGHHFPVIGKIAALKPLHFALLKLYKFISFNRKVIAPSSTYLQQSCVPDFHLMYRLLYLLISAVLTSSVLYGYSFLLSGLLPPSNVAREFLVCFGQLACQSLLLLAVKSRRQVLFDYLGNMMTVSLIGALLLLPAFAIHALVVLPVLFYLVYFMAVVALMFCLHLRRVSYIGAPWWLSLSWVLYRCLVLLVII